MQRITDLVISILATLVAFLLSWPFWRDFSYWAESTTWWLIYFVLGFVLCVYVFYIFIGSLRILFTHAADEAMESLGSNPDGQREGGDQP